MITILERGGRVASAAGPGERLLRFGPSPRFSPGITISCQGEDQLVVSQQIGEDSKVLPCEARDDGVSCRLSDEETIVFLRSPWGRESLLLSLEGTSRVYVVPFQAWWREQWYDQALYYLHKGQVGSWVGPGSAGRLVLGEKESGVAEDWEQWWPKQRAQAWKQSLALGLRAKLGALPWMQQVRIADWSVCTAALLLGLRSAYPDRIIGLTKDSPPPSPAWKRLCQNLDIDLIGTTSECPTLFLDGLWPSSDKGLFYGFLEAFQNVAPIVPQKLLHSWSQL